MNLKNLAENSSFVKNLTQLYQKCVEECAIPSIWKTANVIALHNKGSKKNAINYRPVSLTCILCNIYEQFIKSHVLSFVEKLMRGLKEERGDDDIEWSTEEGNRRVDEKKKERGEVILDDVGSRIPGCRPVSQLAMIIHI